MLDLSCVLGKALKIWLVDLTGNIAATDASLVVLKQSANLNVPAFVSSEEAMEWGSRLNTAQRATLVDIQRNFSNAAQEKSDLQSMVNRATQSQLIGETAEAFRSDLPDSKVKGLGET